MRQMIFRIFEYWNLLVAFMGDYRFCTANSISLGRSTKDKRLARIMLLMHAIEKGLSFTKSAREFGGDKAKSLTSLVRKYLTLYDIDDTCIVAINVLHEYMKNVNSTKDDKIRSDINSLLQEHQDIIKNGLAGTKKVAEPPTFDKNVIESFFASRSSVRNFSDALVTNDEVMSALHIASFTPSACNRQTSRVHVFRDKEVMKAIIDNQLGNQNWCDNATVLFVITANASYFGGVYERHQALVDGGLYAMNFVYGLHMNHVATCFKMFVRSPKLEKEFRRLTGILPCEIPVVLVLAGHYMSSAIDSPKSVRIPFGFEKFSQ